jgi:biopolymer transport protein ExbB
MHRHLIEQRLKTRLAAFALLLGIAGSARADTDSSLDPVLHRAELAAQGAMDWYRRTPSHERMTWGGLAACVLLGLGVVGERVVRLRRRRVLPAVFVEKLLLRLAEGRLDRGKALDFCEMSPSPAARVALAAVRRWGRSVSDLERAVSLARQVEVDRLMRNVGTLRRIAVLAPMLGLLGTLLSSARGLQAITPQAIGTPWGAVLAAALAPLTGGVALAILALVAYDGLIARVEALAGELDRLGSETVDAIMLATPEPRGTEARADLPAASRAPHARRLNLPEAMAETMERERDLS